MMWHSELGKGLSTGRRSRRPRRSWVAGPAVGYAAMGLLGDELPTNHYDPGMFWSGDGLPLLGGARLGAEIRVLV